MSLLTALRHLLPLQRRVDASSPTPNARCSWASPPAILNNNPRPHSWNPAMRWAKSEYILKGVFLGLLLFVSLQKDVDWATTGRVALWLLGGLGVALIIAAARQFKDIKGLGRNP